MWDLAKLNVSLPGKVLPGEFLFSGECPNKGNERGVFPSRLKTF